MQKKWFLIIIASLLLVGLLAWLFIESSKPLPGEAALQDGRSHLPEGSKVEYKFNPPTSGDHYPSWITKGFYDTPRADGYLVHSLEHGYIIIWYDCENKVQSSEFRVQNGIALNLIETAYAQSTSMTSGSEGSASAKIEDLPKAFFNGSCDNLKSQLKDVYQKFGPHKLIIMPRVGMNLPGLGGRIVLTAWGRKDRLASVDENRIKWFIDAFRDAGPEQTVEP